MFYLFRQVTGKVLSGLPDTEQSRFFRLRLLEFFRSPKLTNVRYFTPLQVWQTFVHKTKKLELSEKK